ncbi:hypothetical protein ABEV41_12055 [Geobacillus thermodenitrificans]|uniref:hypothetical protein n=1 Tax=Geobacillus thermodenitrificans TaxID=33940 RepID=UPI002E094BD6|nr:hypothetical protein [Geobacillus thermodenitrificans]
MEIVVKGDVFLCFLEKRFDNKLTHPDESVYNPIIKSIETFLFVVIVGEPIRL